MHVNTTAGDSEWISPEVVLVTAAQLPKLDPETHLLLDSLTKTGVRAVVLPWSAKILWKEVPLVVLRTPWDYFEKPDEFLSWAAAVEKETRLVNPYDVLKWNIHKEYMLDLARHGVPTIPTRVIRAADFSSHTAPLLDLPARGLTGDTIVKPAVSIGAFGLLLGDAKSLELGTHAHALLASGKDVLVQPFVHSVRDKGEVSLVFFNGGRFSHAIRKVPVQGDFRVQDHHGGSVVPHVATVREIEVARMALGTAPCPEEITYARVDLVEGDNGEPVVMELELIEPELFLRYSQEGLRIFTEHIVQLLRGSDVHSTR